MNFFPNLYRQFIKFTSILTWLPPVLCCMLCILIIIYLPRFHTSLDDWKLGKKPQEIMFNFNFTYYLLLRFFLHFDSIAVSPLRSKLRMLGGHTIKRFTFMVKFNWWICCLLNPSLSSIIIIAIPACFLHLEVFKANFSKLVVGTMHVHVLNLYAG